MTKKTQCRETPISACSTTCGLIGQFEVLNKKKDQKMTTALLMVNGQMIQNRQLRFQMKNSRRRRVRAIASMLACWMLLASPTIGVTQAWDITPHVEVENDFFFPGEGDDDYTSGLRISLDINRSLGWSPFCSYRDCHETSADSSNSPGLHTTLMFGQNFYTPQDIEKSEVQEDDRPYAAWLYAAFASRLAETKRVRTFELHVGTTGKCALGEEVQTWWHGLIDAPKPNGWDHQVKPVSGGVGYIGIWEDKGLRDCQNVFGTADAEFLPYYRLTIGNVHTNAAIGATIRLGWNLGHNNQFLRATSPWLDPTRVAEVLKKIKNESRIDLTSVYREKLKEILMPDDSLMSKSVPDSEVKELLETLKLDPAKSKEFSELIKELSKLLDPSQPNWSVYGFISGEGRAVGYNALLQHDRYKQVTGTPYTLSPIPIKRILATIGAGIGVSFCRISLRCGLVWRTPEYDMGRRSKYGSISITYSHKRSNR